MYKVWQTKECFGYNNYRYHGVTCEFENGKYLLYIYNAAGEFKLQKPIDIQVIKNDDIDTIKNISYFRNFNTIELKEQPEDLKLFIPEFYKRDDIKYEDIADNEISNDILNKLKSNMNAPFIIVGETFNNKKIHGSEKIDYNEYLCQKCKNTFSRNSFSTQINCPHCGYSSYKKIISKEFADYLNENYCTQDYYSSRVFRTEKSSKNRVFFLDQHPESENGIIIYNLIHEMKFENNTLINSYKISFSIEHIVSEKTIAYKHLKKGKKKCDAFDVLNINTKNILVRQDVIYNNFDNFLDFANNNEKFLKMSGFQDLLKYASINLKLEPFFMVFIGIVNKYPAMEYIIKMGHAKLFYDIYDKMIKSLNKEEIARHINMFKGLINNEATKGKYALRFPNYISEYLIRKNAQLEEYYYWRDLYEITSISKEQFENLISSFNFAWVNSQIGLHNMSNILKFNYNPQKLFNYIVKISKSNNLELSDVIYNLKDYLNMCDIAQIEPDKFPKDLVKVHNDMINYCKERDKKETDKLLNNIGTECEEYIIPNKSEINKIGIPKLFESLSVVFPKSEADLINEGNQQHNCVGSYSKGIKDGSCVIFFIRQKETPTKSFITAECTQKGLGQCFYSNNRPVKDENLVKFANYVANKIKSGCSSGKINALFNINNKSNR